MIFKRVAPTPNSASWIECFWVIQNDDPKQVTQKIIPDGFPEIIFHFGDPYEINLDGKWEKQARSLLAGQIRKFFWLRNTGKASMLGVKLNPSCLTQVFDFNMSEFTDRVEDMGQIKNPGLKELESRVRESSSFESQIENITHYFENIKYEIHPVNRALEKVFESRGMNSVSDLANELKISERQLERIFKQYVGLSPKFYSRIIRFSTIFQLKEQGDPNWIDLTYESGFADQSHFIRNFKAFTGEDPSSYSFGDQNMANFFMKKK
jgi:AraC-like DNA-binding protein